MPVTILSADWSSLLQFSRQETKVTPAETPASNDCTPAPPNNSTRTAPGRQSRKNAPAPSLASSNSTPSSIPKQHLHQHPKPHRLRPRALPSRSQQRACTVTCMPYSTRPSIVQKCTRAVTSILQQHPKQHPKTAPAPAPQTASPAPPRPAVKVAKTRLHRHLHALQHPAVNRAKMHPRRH